VINVLVAEIAELEREPPAPAARAGKTPTRPPPPPRRERRKLAVAELREVAPAGHSFGRRG
jgi:hypothetical protein